MLRAFFTRVPEHDLSETAPCFASCYECCYASACDFYASEQEGSWSSAPVGVRRYYERLEAQDRERAIATKRRLLRALCDASDGGAWSSTFTGDVIGYVPRLGVYYIVGRPALMVFTDAGELASHMPVESRHLIHALFMVAELDYFFTPPE